LGGAFCVVCRIERVRVGIAGNDSEPITGFGSAVSDARVAACRLPDKLPSVRVFVLLSASGILLH